MYCTTYTLAGIVYAGLRITGVSGGFIASGRTNTEAITNAFNIAAQYVA